MQNLMLIAIKKKIKALSEQTEYYKAASIKGKRKIPFGEKQLDLLIINRRDEYRDNCFLVIIETLSSELKKRTEAYK